MRRLGFLCAGTLALFIVTTSLAYADNGGYTVSFGLPPEGVPASHGEMRAISFWELPLWIQMFYLSSAAAAVIVVLKLVPFAFLRLKGKQVNRNRETIYRHITGNPGCTVSDISREQSMNVGNVRYHVDQLRDARRIVLIKFGKFVRLFRNSGAYAEREITIISALHVRTNHAILFLIRNQPGLSNKQIAERLEIKESMAHAYLSDLLRLDIIRYEKNGQQKMYYLESDVQAILAKVGSVPASQGIGVTV